MCNIQATVDNVVYSDFYLKHLKLIQYIYIYIYKFIYEIKVLNKDRYWVFCCFTCHHDLLAIVSWRLWFYQCHRNMHYWNAHDTVTWSIMSLGPFIVTNPTMCQLHIPQFEICAHFFYPNCIVGFMRCVLQTHLTNCTIKFSLFECTAS